MSDIPNIKQFNTRTINLDGDGSILTITIPAGTQLSLPFDCRGTHILRILIPDIFTSTSIGFQDSYDGGATFYDAYNVSDDLVSFSVQAGRSYSLDPRDLYGTRWVKIKTSDIEVAERKIKIITGVY